LASTDAKIFPLHPRQSRSFSKPQIRARTPLERAADKKHKTTLTASKEAHYEPLYKSFYDGLQNSNNKIIF
jgi:hypothetical protein